MTAVATWPVGDSLAMARPITSIVVSGLAHVSMRSESAIRDHQLASAARAVATRRTTCMASGQGPTVTSTVQSSAMAEVTPVTVSRAAMAKVPWY